MDKLIDMHNHTTFSDGELSPMELIEYAYNNNVGIMAITDHDTLNGVLNIDRNHPLLINNDIIVYNGIELSVKRSKGTMHILGIDIDVTNKALTGKMNQLRDNSINYIISILHQIKVDYGIRFTYEDLNKLFNANHNLGRPDIAKLLIKYNYASTIDEAFKKYLIPAKEKIRDALKGLSYYECLRLITGANGIPVLAHPKSLELSEKDFLILLKDMINHGLRGIEVYHSSHTKEEMDYYLNIARKYNLLISGGSDYHGPLVKPDVEIGTGVNNNLKIKQLSLIDELKKRH
jgi:hypothetical protein